MTCHQEQNATAADGLCAIGGALEFTGFTGGGQHLGRARRAVGGAYADGTFQSSRSSSFSVSAFRPGALRKLGCPIR